MVTPLPAADWGWQNPLPQGNTIYSSWAISAQSAVFAGANGTIGRTTDGGTSWVVVNGLNGFTGTFRTIAFTDEIRGICGGDDGAMFYSIDGGISWAASTASFSKRGIYSISAVSAVTAFAVGDSGLIAKTGNGGSTWSALPSGTRQPIRAASFLNDSVGWVAGDSGLVLRTTDGGLHWQQQSTGYADGYTGIAFVDPGTGVLAGTPNVMMRTTDGGVNWSDIVYDGSIFPRTLHVGQNHVLYGAGPSGILLSSNSGTSWHQRTIESQVLFYDVSFSDTLHGWVGGTGGKIASTTDAGNTWQLFLHGVMDNIMTLSVTDSSHFIAAGDNGQIFQSSDGGRTIQHSQPAGSATIWTCSSFPTAQRGYIVGDSGKCFMTSDAGLTWNRQATPETNFLTAVSFSDENTGWIGGNRCLFVTTDGGMTWHNRALVDENFSIQKMTFFNDKSGVILANGLVGGQTRLLHTSDGGISWTGRSTPSTGAITSICFIDSIVGWAVGNGNTLFYTIDGGYSWAAGRLPLSKLYTNIWFVSENTGWVTSTDGTVLKTTDGGSVWSQLSISGTVSPSSMRFADASTGWIVGASGMILKSTNGGGSGTAFPPSGPPPVRRPAAKELSNFPNPVTASTYLPFDNLVAGDVSVQVLGLDGRIVRHLFQGPLRAGQYRTAGRAPEWNGLRDDGIRVTSGIYFYRIITPAKTIFRKLIYLR